METQNLLLHHSSLAEALHAHDVHQEDSAVVPQGADQSTHSDPDEVVLTDEEIVIIAYRQMRMDPGEY